MSLVSSRTGMMPAPSNADVEFARQPIERALIENVEMPLPRPRPGIDQLLRIDTRSRGAGDVADVVGAGAARAQADVLNRFHDVDRILGLDLAQLQIGARGDMGVGAAKPLRNVRHGGELPMLEDPVRNAQPAHVGTLRRRHIEQAVIAPAEIVRRLGWLVLCGLILQAWIGVEWVLVALELLLLRQLPARRQYAVLRLAMDCIRPDWLACGRRRAGTGRARRGEAGDETLQVALLLRREIAGHVTPP